MKTTALPLPVLQKPAGQTQTQAPTQGAGEAAPVVAEQVQQASALNQSLTNIMQAHDDLSRRVAANVAHDVSVSVGGAIAGMAKASASSTPALQGKNLRLPGDLAAAHFKPLLKEMAELTASAGRGAMKGKLLDDAVLATLTKAGVPSAEVANELWTPAGAKTRGALLQAFDALAAATPHSVGAVFDGHPRTVEFLAAHMHATEASLQGDVAEQRKWGAALVRIAPNDPLATWAKGLAES